MLDIFEYSGDPDVGIPSDSKWLNPIQQMSRRAAAPHRRLALGAPGMGGFDGSLDLLQIGADYTCTGCPADAQGGFVSGCNCTPTAKMKSKLVALQTALNRFAGVGNFNAISLDGKPGKDTHRALLTTALYARQRLKAEAKWPGSLLVDLEKWSLPQIVKHTDELTSLLQSLANDWQLVGQKPAPKPAPKQETKPKPGSGDEPVPIVVGEPSGFPVWLLALAAAGGAYWYFTRKKPEGK